ncbi:MAG: class I SAM-dependent methyltransferase [Flavobacteriales bacterium]
MAQKAPSGEARRETLAQCPICNSAEQAFFLSCKDHTVSGEHFDIQECSNCRFRYTDPRPAEESIGDYYESEAYISHSNKTKGPIDALYKVARQYTVRKKHRTVRRSAENLPLTILDHGCGTGEFLAQCQKKGWQVHGLEPDEGARQQATELLGGNVDPPDTLNALPSESFSIITLWHVLEHVPRLQETVRELKRVLRPEGTLFIAVPNCSSNDAEHYGACWAAYDVPRHLYHFRPPNIRQLFEDHGMVVREVRPMLLDGIYVSMLSEKYQGKMPWKGVWTGLKSNMKADLEKETYSAQIYLIGHRGAT